MIVCLVLSKTIQFTMIVFGIIVVVEDQRLQNPSLYVCFLLAVNMRCSNPLSVSMFFTQHFNITGRKIRETQSLKNPIINLSNICLISCEILCSYKSYGYLAANMVQVLPKWRIDNFDLFLTLPSSLNITGKFLAKRIVRYAMDLENKI